MANKKRGACDPDHNTRLCVQQMICEKVSQLLPVVCADNFLILILRLAHIIEHCDGSGSIEMSCGLY